MEETTTSTPVDDTSASVTEQADTTEQAVDTTAIADDTDQPESEQGVEPSEDDEIDMGAWAKKKGLKYDLDNPNEVRLARMVYEGDQKVTRAGQEARQLKESVTTASADLDDIQQLRNELGVMNFFQQYPDARKLESEMSTVLDAKPYFANDLEGLYFYTKGMQADRGLVAAKQAGGKEALAAAAQSERAAAPKSSASTRVTPKELTNEDIRNMSTEEYQKAKADGRLEPFGPKPE